MLLRRLSLIPDWKSVIRRAWSIRLMLVAGLLSGVEVVLPLFVDALPRGLFAAVSGSVVMLAFAARLVAQQGLSK